VACCGALGALALGLNLLPVGPWVFSDVDFAFLEPKIARDIRQEVRSVIDHGQKGVTLARFDYSWVFPMLTADFPQYSWRFGHAKHPRILAYRYAYGLPDGSAECFTEAAEQLTNVVLIAGAPNNAAVLDVLEKMGYARVYESERIVLMSRGADRPASAEPRGAHVGGACWQASRSAGTRSATVPDAQADVHASAASDGNP
jgi:hypothetical protein